MVIQTTPQTELTQPGIPNVQETKAYEHEKESLVNGKQQKSKLGVFAKILAGLQSKASAKTGLAGPAENAEFNHNKLLIETRDAEMPDIEDAKLVLNKKKTRAGKAEKSLEDEKNGENEPNLALNSHLANQQIEFSQKEKNILSNVNRLTKQPEEHVSLEEENARLRFNALHETENNEKLSSQQLAQNSQAAGNQNKKETKNRINHSETEANGMNAGEKAGNNETVTLAARQAAMQAEAKKASVAEKNGRSKVEEARDKRRSVDGNSRSAELQAGDMQKNAVQLKAGMERPVEGTAKEINLELRLSNQGQEASSAFADSSATTSWEAKAGQAFEDILARELHQNFNNDIVRHASVALREGNEGTIRLVLKPESLGNVKIRLELAENKITGHIVVQSEEALRAFEREISSLEKAFEKSGFDGANFEMSLAADGRGTEQWQGTEASRALPDYFAALRYDTAAENMDMPQYFNFYGQGTGTVNLFA